MKLFELKRFFVVMLLVCLGVGQSWGHSTHYGKATVTSGGHGSVYISTSNTATSGNTTETWNCNGSSGNDSKTYYLFAKADDGFKFTGWSGSATSTSSPFQIKPKATSEDQGNPTQFNYTASFVWINNFKATAKVEARIFENNEYRKVEDFPITVDGKNSENTQEYNERPESETEKKFTFTLRADDTEDYAFIGWAETIEGTPELTNESPYSAEVTCYATNDDTPHDHFVEKTWYAIYQKKNTFKATVTVKTACEGVEGDFGTVSVIGENPKNLKKLADSHDFTFTVKAENDSDDDYEFLGWSEYINATNFTSGNTSISRTWDGYKVTCLANAEVSKTLYAIYALKNTFKATVTAKTACGGEEGNFGTVSVVGNNTQDWKELTPNHEFTFEVNAQNTNYDYEFQGWSEDKTATSFNAPNTSSSANWNNYKVTCNADDAVTKDLYAIYKHKVHHTATMTAHVVVQEETFSQAGTVTVNGNANTYTHTGYQVDSQDFEFTLKAIPAKGHIFIGWAETEDGNIISKAAEWKPDALTCTTETPVTKDYYAVFSNDLKEVAMKPKKPIDAYHLTQTKPADDVPFIIMDITDNIAMAPQSGSVGTGVSAGLTNSQEDGTYYAGDVNSSTHPRALYFESGKYIYYYEGNTKTYLIAENTGSLFNNPSAQLATTTNISRTDANHKEFTWAKASNGVEITIKPALTTFWLEYTTEGFNLVKNGNKKAVRLLEFEENSAGEVVTEKINIRTEEGYCTYYNSDAYMMPEGLEGSVIVDANIVGVAEEEGTLRPVALYHGGDIVPAGTALLIKGTKGEHGTTLYTDRGRIFTATATRYKYLDDNQLEGTRDANNYTASTRDDVLYYKFTYENSNYENLGFYWGATDGAPFKLNNPNTAYLAVERSAANSAHGYSLPMGDDDVINRIEVVDVVESKADDDAVYNISGMRINDSKNLPAGIYIRNGKKFIVR